MLCEGSRSWSMIYDSSFFIISIWFSNCLNYTPWDHYLLKWCTITFLASSTNIKYHIKAFQKVLHMYLFHYKLICQNWTTRHSNALMLGHVNFFVLLLGFYNHVFPTLSNLSTCLISTILLALFIYSVATKYLMITILHGISIVCSSFTR